MRWVGLKNVIAWFRHPGHQVQNSHDLRSQQRMNFFLLTADSWLLAPDFQDSSEFEIVEKMQNDVEEFRKC